MTKCASSPYGLYFNEFFAKVDFDMYPSLSLNVKLWYAFHHPLSSFGNKLQGEKICFISLACTMLTRVGSSSIQPKCWSSSNIKDLSLQTNNKVIKQNIFLVL